MLSNGFHTIKLNPNIKINIKKTHNAPLFVKKGRTRHPFFYFRKECVCVYDDEIVAFDFMFFAKRTHQTHFLPSKSFFYIVLVFFLIWKKCVLCVWCILFHILLRPLCVLLCLVMK